MSIFAKKQPEKPVEKTTEKTEKQPIFTKETLGVVIILFATLCLVCLITREKVFSGVGQAVNSFLFGCFGYFAYLVMLFAMYLGIVCVAGKSLQLSKKLVIFLTLSFITLSALVHVITVQDYQIGYGEYIAKSFTMASEGGITTCSGGGAVIAVIAYLFPLVLQGVVASCVVLAILFVVCLAMLVKTIVKEKKGESPKNELRTSFVKTQNDSMPETGVDLQGVKDYPVDFAVPEEPKGVQKLFVIDASKDDFKVRPKAKEGEVVPVAKIDYTRGGLGVASMPTSYTQNYSQDIKSKLDYIKTPAPINLDKPQTYYSAPTIPNNQTAQTRVSDYITNREEPKVDIVKTPETPSSQNTLPFFEHTAHGNDAESHAARFSNLADIRETPSEEVDAVNTEVVRPVEIQPESVIEPQPIEQQFTHFEENAEDIFGSRNSRRFIQSEENEEPEVEQPLESNVTRERVRNIFLEPDVVEEVDNTEQQQEPIVPERPSYTSRVSIDGNLSSRRMGFVEPEPQVQPVQEEKPKKPAPPINREYFRPPFDLLQKYEPSADAPKENHAENMEIIKQTLADFHINAEPQDYVQGPSITRYEITMPAGISVKKVLNYDDDLRMRLSSKEGVRIEAPIPGKNLVGIEVANKIPQMVGLREVMELAAAQDGKAKPGSLMFALGKDIVGKAITDNLAKGPHYLVAGATGSGKSVCLNTMIVSLIMRYSPEELRLFLVDPKGVEFATYEHLPHLMIDEIITSPQKAIEMLKWAYLEMERRFSVFRECNAGIVNIDDYNANIASDTVAKMPRIVIIIDELADLMQTCKKDLEARICAIAQKARSAGIHLVLATQRPSVDVITGTIKANLPSRIAFKVMNFADSQTILSEAGAEKLLGNGDMLYKNAQMPGVARYQGAYIHMREVNNVVNFIKEHNTAYFDDELQEYLEKAANPQPTASPTQEGGASQEGGENNEMFLRALWFAVNSGTISISSMQRRFGIGFSRAGGIMDKMDRMGFVSPNEGGRARKVLLTREEYEEKFGQAPPDEL